MKPIVYFSFIMLLFVSACDLSDLIKKVEVNYEVEFSAEEGEEAVVIYYNPKGELVEENITVGSWSFKGIFDDGSPTGVWVDTDAGKGYIDVYLVIWYSELNDLEDYVDANMWTLPISDKVGLSSIVSRDTTTYYPVSYSVNVEGTNGVPVNIKYTDADYDSQSLLSEASKLDGLWEFDDEFAVGSYASVSVTSEATIGSAIITITVDYDDKSPVTKTETVDFTTTTKSGAIGFAVE